MKISSADSSTSRYPPQLWSGGGSSFSRGAQSQAGNRTIVMAKVPLLLLAVFLLSGLCSGQDYEEDRLPIRSRNPRGPIVPSRAVKAQAIQKTSTTEAPPLEPEEEEYEDELIEEEPTTTTTEAPKKVGLRGGVLRPFRSNADLIEALKRRRAQAQSGGSSYNSVSSTSTTTTTTESTRQSRKSKGKFSRGGSQRDSSTTEQPLEEQAAPRSRAFGGRGRRF